MEKSHLYHLMDSSPWPLASSLGAFTLTSGLVCYMHSMEYGLEIFSLGLLMMLFTMYVWWRDVISESTYQGNHTIMVQSGLSMGFVLFMASEIMFFSGFFWAFFHSSLSPSMLLGAVWPPVNIVPLNPYGVPMLNTAVLLLSGFSITWVHFALIAGSFELVRLGFIVTLVLAVGFTLLQIGEYFTASFNITDSVFGSAFYSLTGLHGLHVIMGSIFISVCFFSFLNAHFTTVHHLGFEFASWYWHSVDVVWLFPYVFVYIWGSW